jgi:Ca2+-binding EF-hand superfamily protein
MCKKAILIFAVLFLYFSSYALAAQVGKVVKFKHADKNNDGVIDKKEWRMEEKWEHKQHSRVNNWWEKMADTNGDGTVDSNELSAWKTLEKERIDLNNDGVIDAKERRLSWRHARSKVNTELERKYDINSNGWLEPEEIREMLKAKHALIISNGQAKVDSELEAEYDINNDGVIDSKEAEALKEDIQ